MLPCAFLKTKMISMVQMNQRPVQWSDSASRKTDLKQPTLPCGLGLKPFSFLPTTFFEIAVSLCYKGTLILKMFDFTGYENTWSLL